MKKRFKYIIIAIIGILSFSTLIGVNYYFNIPKNRKESVNNITLIVNYAGEKPVDKWDNFSLYDGKTTVIYALLEKCEVEMTGTPENDAFVKAINGIKQYENLASYFWLFFVNGKQSQVGSSLYTLDNGDLIWWNYTNQF
ncbi:MAG: hypothetical protein BAJALOKI3v1_150075 [Promethearchaeota archaeon]|nr:MAG: hypothetical protein BAJALOKI3v1_150075 [Candidatus Lokiarchaeota archaeon]